MRTIIPGVPSYFREIFWLRIQHAARIAKITIRSHGMRRAHLCDGGTCPLPHNAVAIHICRPGAEQHLIALELLDGGFGEAAEVARIVPRREVALFDEEGLELGNVCAARAEREITSEVGTSGGGHEEREEKKKRSEKKEFLHARSMTQKDTQPPVRAAAWGYAF